MKKIVFVLLAALVGVPFSIFLLTFSERKYQETKSISVSKTIEEQFDKIYVNSISGDIELIIGDNKNTSLDYNEDDVYTYEFIQGNEENKKVLKINQKKINDSKFNFFDKNNNMRKMKITIPNKNVESVIIDNSYGDNRIDSLSCNNININSKAGDIKIGKLTCNNMKINAKYGDIILGSISAGNSSIVSKAGDIEVNNSNCSDLEINNSSGNVSLRDLDSYKLVIKSRSGDIGLMRVKCDSIYSSTSIGNIYGCILGDKKDYKIISSVDIGDNNLENKSDGDKTLDLKTQTGDIGIDFEMPVAEITKS